MSTSFPIPDGYSSSGDALKREEARWGTADAAPKLVGLILGGKLPSFSSDARGNLHEISPEAWQNIDTVRVLQEQEFRNFRDFPSGLSKGRPVFIESDLRRELPFDWEIREAEKSGSDLSVKKGGPPLKYDWDAMWIEVVRISEHDVFPKTRAELVNKLLQWFEDHYKTAPGETAIKGKISRLFGVLEKDVGAGR